MSLNKHSDANSSHVTQNAAENGKCYCSTFKYLIKIYSITRNETYVNIPVGGFALHPWPF